MKLYPAMLLLGSIVLSATSCVSKKNHLAAIQAEQQVQQQLQGDLETSQQENDSLMLALAHQRGANEALYNTQDRLQDRLDVLQLEIDQLGANASTTVQQLRSTIKSKEQTITERQAVIEAATSLLDKYNNQLESVDVYLNPVWEDLEEGVYSTRQQEGGLIIALSEELLFTKGSTSRMTKNGQEVLTQIAEILMRFPQMNVTIIGHTDNRRVNRQSLDNWQYSALRGVSVVKYLTDETDLGANRVLAASKSEYAPLQSNETEEGRAANRRVELVVEPSRSTVFRELNNALRP